MALKITYKSRLRPQILQKNAQLAASDDRMAGGDQCKWATKNRLKYKFPCDSESEPPQHVLIRAG